ncbi:hypothetical protein ACLKA6_006050 [Drosophila palustris]
MSFQYLNDIARLRAQRNNLYRRIQVLQEPKGHAQMPKGPRMRLEQQQLPAQPFTHLPLQMYQPQQPPQHLSPQQQPPLQYLAPQQMPPKSQKKQTII